MHVVAKAIPGEVQDHEQQGQRDEDDQEHHDPTWGSRNNGDKSSGRNTHVTTEVIGALCEHAD